MQSGTTKVRFSPQESTKFHLINKINTHTTQEDKFFDKHNSNTHRQKCSLSSNPSLFLKKRSRQPKKQQSIFKKKKKSDQYKYDSGQINTEDKKAKISKILHIRKLIITFINKLSYNNIFRKPVQFDPLDNTNFQHQKYLFCSLKLSFPVGLQFFMHVIRLLYIITYIFLLPLLFIVEQMRDWESVLVIKVIGIILSMFDILKSFQNQAGHQYQNIAKQAYHQLIKVEKYKIIKHCFIILCIILSIITSYQENLVSLIFFLFVSLNLAYYFKSLSILEQQFFTATHYENYWKICKVFILNILVGHAIACLLFSISFTNFSNNWMIKNNINSTIWYEQYIWSYYFGTAIILTIGFGDLHPTNPVQALVVILISFFGCAFFGYNINYMGNLINNIRQQQLEKNHKLKVVNSMAKKSQLSKETLSQITNYIVQQSKIKKQFNQAQEKQIIQELPQALKSSFLREVNHKLFNQLKKVIDFSNKTIQNLSLAIEAKICHPNQIIRKMNKSPSLIILQFGQVGLIARKSDSLLNKCIIQRISIRSNQQSKLICIDILSKKSIKYDIKSLTYSAINQISKQQFQKCLKLQNKDYQLYCETLDKCQFQLDEFNMVNCQFCKQSKHTLFQCPRLHFVPLKDHVARKSKHHIIKQQSKQQRVKFQRKKMYTYIDYVKQQISFSQSIQQDSNLSIQNIKSIKTIEQQIRQQAKERMKGIKQYNICKRNKTHGSGNIQIKSKSSKTIQMISQLRLELENMRNQPKTAKLFQFFLWQNDDCDTAYNFTHYFPSSNPDNLKNIIPKALKRLASKNVKLIRKKTAKTL